MQRLISFSPMKLMVLAIAILSSIGCDTPRNGSGTVMNRPKVDCKTVVKYSGNSIEVTSIELPIAGNTYKVGRIGFTPQQIQEAKQLTQALDLLQFADCQTMQLLTDEEKIAKLADRRAETFKALATILKDLDKAKSEKDTEKAIEKGNDKKDQLEKQK